MLRSPRSFPQAKLAVGGRMLAQPAHGPHSLFQRIFNDVPRLPGIAPA
jgi:hypothetical protein